MFDAQVNDYITITNANLRPLVETDGRFVSGFKSFDFHCFFEVHKDGFQVAGNYELVRS